MTKLIYAIAFLLIFGGLSYHFAAVRLFTLLVPKDAGVERIASGVAYGPDERQRLDIYRPLEGDRPLPVIVFIFGGSWKKGSRSDYSFAGHALAARGYLVLVADYRLMPQHVFPAFVEDTAAAIAFAAREAQRFGGDPKRIFAIGHSAGGYNVAQAVLDPRYLAAAGLPPRSLRAAAVLSAPLDFLPLDSPVTKAAFGHVRPLEETQPVTFARADAPPLFIATGAADTTVKPRNSRSLAEKLAARGGVATLREYEGVSHTGLMLAFAKPFRRRAPVLDNVMGFFAALGGAPLK